MFPLLDNEFCVGDALLPLLDDTLERLDLLVVPTESRTFLRQLLLLLGSCSLNKVVDLAIQLRVVSVWHTSTDFNFAFCLSSSS